MLGVDTALPLSRLSEATNIKLPTGAIPIDPLPPSPPESLWRHFLLGLDELVEVQALHNWLVRRGFEGQHRGVGV